MLLYKNGMNVLFKKKNDTKYMFLISFIFCFLALAAFKKALEVAKSVNNLPAQAELYLR